MLSMWPLFLLSVLKNAISKYIVLICTQPYRLYVNSRIGTSKMVFFYLYFILTLISFLLFKHFILSKVY